MFFPPSYPARQQASRVGAASVTCPHACYMHVHVYMDNDSPLVFLLTGVEEEPVEWVWLSTSGLSLNWLDSTNARFSSTGTL